MSKSKEHYQKYRLYYLLLGMRWRCYRPSRPDYPRYGGRGITVCDEWLREPRMFYQWARTHGFEPHLQIDRIDNNKGYSPDNCRFVTRKENNRNKRTNRRLTFRGETRCLVEWVEKTGIKESTLRRRMDVCHWSVERALTTPVQHHRRKRQGDESTTNDKNKHDNETI